MYVLKCLFCVLADIRVPCESSDLLAAPLLNAWAVTLANEVCLEFEGEPHDEPHRFVSAMGARISGGYG